MKMYTVMYTHQKTKKKKVWQDGVLRCTHEGPFIKAVLYAEEYYEASGRGAPMIESCSLDSMWRDPSRSLVGNTFEWATNLVEVMEERNDDNSGVVTEASNNNVCNSTVPTTTQTANIGRVEPKSAALRRGLQSSRRRVLMPQNSTADTIPSQCSSSTGYEIAHGTALNKDFGGLYSGSGCPPGVSSKQTVLQSSIASSNARSISGSGDTVANRGARAPLHPMVAQRINVQPTDLANPITVHPSANPRTGGSERQVDPAEARNVKCGHSMMRNFALCSILSQVYVATDVVAGDVHKACSSALQSIALVNALKTYQCSSNNTAPVSASSHSAAPSMQSAALGVNTPTQFATTGILNKSTSTVVPHHAAALVPYHAATMPTGTYGGANYNSEAGPNAKRRKWNYDFVDSEQSTAAINADENVYNGGNIQQCRVNAMSSMQMQNSGVLAALLPRKTSTTDNGVHMDEHEVNKVNMVAIPSARHSGAHHNGDPLGGHALHNPSANTVAAVSQLDSHIADSVFSVVAGIPLDTESRLTQAGPNFTSYTNYISYFTAALQRQIMMSVTGGIQQYKRLQSDNSRVGNQSNALLTTIHGGSDRCMPVHLHSVNLKCVASKDALNFQKRAKMRVQKDKEKRIKLVQLRKAHKQRMTRRQNKQTPQLSDDDNEEDSSNDNTVDSENDFGTSDGANYESGSTSYQMLLDFTPGTIDPSCTNKKSVMDLLKGAVCRGDIWLLSNSSNIDTPVDDGVIVRSVWRGIQTQSQCIAVALVGELSSNVERIRYAPFKRQYSNLYLLTNCLEEITCLQYVHSFAIERGEVRFRLERLFGIGSTDREVSGVGDTTGVLLNDDCVLSTDSTAWKKVDACMNRLTQMLNKEQTAVLLSVLDWFKDTSTDVSDSDSSCIPSAKIANRSEHGVQQLGCGETFTSDQETEESNDQDVTMQYSRETDNCPSSPPGVAADVILVHGVFGAGKTKVLAYSIELLRCILESISAHETVLFVAATNLAVDNVLLRLLQELQWGHFARLGAVTQIDPRLLSYAVSTKQVKDFAAADFNTAFTRALRSSEVTNEARADIQRLLSDLLQHKRFPMNAAEWKKRRLLACTCNTALTSDVLSPFELRRVSVLIMDEATQVLEPIAFSIAQRFKCKHLLLVGDPRQLPPTLKDHRSPLKRSLFERLGELTVPVVRQTITTDASTTVVAKNGIKRIFMNVQYRCHPVLSSACSSIFYGGALMDGVVADDRLPVIQPWGPLVFILCTDGREEKSKFSYVNSTEANVVLRVLDRVCAAVQSSAPKTPPCTTADSSITAEIMPTRRKGGATEIGIIALYRAQADLLCRKVTMDTGSNTNTKVQVATVDSFQGTEKDVIIMSCVRSCTPSRSERTPVADFWDCPRRVNVALTRARCQLVVVASVKFLESSAVWSQIRKRATTVMWSHDI